jgi:hypothetical protein
MIQNQPSDPATGHLGRALVGTLLLCLAVLVAVILPVRR